MKIKPMIYKCPTLFGIIITALMVMIVDFFQVPNPNVILLTGIVYVTFIGGFIPGGISGLMVVLYSLYFFSLPHNLYHYSSNNIKKLIVIVIFIPIMVVIVGTLKKQYLNKTKELELANERLKKMAQLDPLTGIPNRRFFEEAYQLEYSNSADKNIPISILMADIDFFKKYNDCHGHLAGDECLVKVSNTLSMMLQCPNCMVARYGGEEFIVLLPNTDIMTAEHIGIEMVQAVEALNIKHDMSHISPNVTISIGASSQSSFIDRNPMNLIQKADQALYQAKDGGRNQAVAKI